MISPDLNLKSKKTIKEWKENDLFYNYDKKNFRNRTISFNYTDV